MSYSKSILKWWQQYLEPKQYDGASRAFRAQLRRSVSPVEVLADARVVELAQDLKLVYDLPRLITLVRVLAAAKDHNSTVLARKLGANTSDVRVMSELRFRRLLRAEQGLELETALLRALRIADGTCNLERLGTDIVWWTDDIRNRWCFEYYGESMSEALGMTDSNLEETTS